MKQQQFLANSFYFNKKKKHHPCNQLPIQSPLNPHSCSSSCHLELLKFAESLQAALKRKPAPDYVFTSFVYCKKAKQKRKTLWTNTSTSLMSMCLTMVIAVFPPCELCVYLFVIIVDALIVSHNSLVKSRLRCRVPPPDKTKGSAGGNYKDKEGWKRKISPILWKKDTKIRPQIKKTTFRSC